MKIGFLWIELLIAALLCLCGCNKSNPIVPPPPPQWFASLQIFMPMDTLRFLPGDSATAQGFVVAKDNAGRGVQGVKVNIELREPFGSVEFVGNQDMTDAQGRVYIIFRTYGQVGPGYNTIHAWVGSKEDSWTLWIQPATEGPLEPYHLIHLSQDTLYSLTDSVVITMDRPGYNIHIPCGMVGSTSAPDSMGREYTAWYLEGCGYGHFCVRATFHSYWIADYACVEVIDSTGGHR